MIGSFSKRRADLQHRIILVHLGFMVFTLACLAACVASVSHSQEASSFIVSEESLTAVIDGSVQEYVLLQPKGFQNSHVKTLIVALHGHGSDRWQYIREPRDECRATRDVALKHGMLLVAPDYRARTSWMGPAAESDLQQIIEDLKRGLDFRGVAPRVRPRRRLDEWDCEHDRIRSVSRRDCGFVWWQ
jgi:poly(3-hydroxybutyrate) depolymerase